MILMKNNDFKYDVYRYYGKYKINVIKLLKHPKLIYLKYFRLCKQSGILSLIGKIKLLYYSRKYQIQIPYKTKIGLGFYIGHLGRIIINPNVIIGKNCNISTGVVIGQENRGSRKGSPTIGNEVWIGANAVIVGKINIGNNVLIAPNSYVNFDVSNNSIVIGNPAKIIYNKNATKDYIDKKI